MNKEVFVLDSCALLALMNKEKGWQDMENILLDVRNGHAEITFHKVNLTELYYDLLRKSGDKKADKIFSWISNLQIKVDYILTDEFIKTVGWFKVNHKVSLADCFALALAKKLNAPLVTSDHHEFDAIEKTKAVKFKWIR